MSILNILAKNPEFHRMFPKSFRKLVRSFVPLKGYNEALWEKRNIFKDTPEEWGNDAGSELTFGILFDPAYHHVSFIKACLELKQSYKVFNFFADQWQQSLETESIDYFLVWPPTVSTVWKKWVDDHAWYLTHELNITTFPDYKAIWLFESKNRMYRYCQLNNIPIPKTHIFYYEKDWDNFLQTVKDTKYIFKSDLGAGSSGVKVLNNKQDLIAIGKKCFNAGFVNPRGDNRDVQWGHLLIQEFLPDVDEIRIIRIGDDFFCRRKNKLNQFHSGSGSLTWHKPTKEMLDLSFKITEKENFKSMAIDIFTTPDGKLFVNELQTVCGVKEIEDNESNGRHYFKNGAWHFERGDFSANKFNNCRIKYLMNLNKNTGSSSSFN